MRRSRSDVAETRERIVSTASKMFLEKGLESVGMRDIMAAVGLTPGGFYRHFESKEQLIAEANDAAFRRLLEMFEAQTAGKSAAEGLETMVSLYLNQSQREGNTYLCPLSMNGGELSHCQPQVQAIALSGYQRLAQMVADRITHVKKAEALAIAGGVVSTLMGAVTLANLAPNKAAARTILSNGHAAVRTLLFPIGSVPTRNDSTTGQRKRSVRE
jgi:TetR/AcrR family transcriptional regulator, transcriptional repressor for nem operon